MEGVVCPIYKKGDKLDCSNYRAITLLNAAYKVLSQILCRRLAPIAREFVGQYQAGFMGERSTTDQVFAIRQVPEVPQIQRARTSSIHRLQSRI